jgi:hypothetical protein
MSWLASGSQRATERAKGATRNTSNGSGDERVIG